MLKVLKWKGGPFTTQKLIMLSIVEKNYLSPNGVKFKSTEGKYQKEYRQLLGKSKPCKVTNFGSMTEKLHADYIDT